MALTRAFLKGMGLTEEQVGAIIEEHVETTNALKEQRDSYKKDADNLQSVQNELDELKQTGGDWQVKYEQEHKAFDDYKAEQDAKQIAYEKREAFKEIIKKAGISESGKGKILKYTDLSSTDFADGKFANEEELIGNLKNEWSEYIVTTEKSGATTATPPSNSGGARMTKEEIFKITDTAERQRAIAENHELFGI